MHSRVADKGLNLKHVPARGIFGMFMNEVLLHCHLQLVSLHTISYLWLDSLCFQQGIEVIARRTSRSILHSSEFCSRFTLEYSNMKLFPDSAPIKHSQTVSPNPFEKNDWVSYWTVVFCKLCCGKRILTCGHSDFGILRNFGMSSIFNWAYADFAQLL